MVPYTRAFITREVGRQVNYERSIADCKCNACADCRIRDYEAALVDVVNYQCDCDNNLGVKKAMDVLIKWSAKEVRETWADK